MTEEDAGHIERLPRATSSLLRSTLVLPSLPQVLVELVQNALDAQSTAIHVYWDPLRWSIKCVDNGHGMSREDLKVLVAVDGDGRYKSSKQLGGKTFGFRGEALGSMKDLARVEIESLRLVDGAGETIQAGWSDEGWVRRARAQRIGGQGTTVVARDIFYKWPVRRRPLTSATAQSNLISTLRSTLASLTLLHPSTTFSLTLVPSSKSEEPRKLLSVSKSPEGLLGRWKQLWGRAGVEDIVAIDEQEGDMALQGFWSLTASHSKSQQFIFVDSRPMSPSSQLQKMINALFTNSTFQRHNIASHLALSPSAAHGTMGKSRKSPKKVVEKWPIFVLDLRVPEELIDITFEPEKRVIEFLDEKRVMSFVEKSTKKFLRAQGWLAPEREDVQAEEKSPLKRALEEAIGERVEKRKVVERKESPVTVQPSLPQESDEPLKWTDPLTRQTYLIDARTGNTWRERDACEQCDGCHASDKRTLVDRSRLRQAVDEGLEPPDWIRQSLQDWSNPVFPAAPPSISALANVLNQVSTTSRSRSTPDQPSRGDSRALDAFFRSPALHSDPSDLGGPISTEDLRSSVFVSQVDNKFLLVKVRSTLFMVDQHAASERVRVEKFFKDLCRAGGVERYEFDQPVPVLVSREEAGVVSQRRGEFERWGMRIDVPSLPTLPSLANEADKEGGSGEEASYVQVYLHSVPRVVADRLAGEPRLRQELVRSFAAQLSSSSSSLPTSSSSSSLLSTQDGGGRADWLSEVRKCPSVLVDLVNSKACRGAIMFNDELTDDQARTLVGSLAETTLPFQCAHGRPSLVPLVRLPKAPAGLPSSSPSSMTNVVGEVDGRRRIDWDRLAL